MLVLNGDEIEALVAMPRLIESLRQAFAQPCSTPPRQVVAAPGGDGDRLLLSMAAFSSDGAGIVKLATVYPDNRDLPTINAALVVFSRDGVPVAFLDGAVITKLRTGAASALASSYLSRTDSSHLVIIGAGALAPYMALAHCAARPITRIGVHGRDRARAAATAKTIYARLANAADVEIVDNLADAVARADIISCATSSATPVLCGQWLKPGAFVDLVGSFSPSKREADDEVVLRSRIFVDTFEGAFSEAGDILDPLKRGIIARDRVEGELADLIAGRVPGRTANDEVITFKSVGAAIEDLAATRLILSL